MSCYGKSDIKDINSPHKVSLKNVAEISQILCLEKNKVIYNIFLFWKTIM